MKAIAVDGANLLLTGEGCFDLPAIRHQHGITCVFEFNAEERAAIARGATFQYTIMSHVFPPIQVGILEAGKLVEEPTMQRPARCAMGECSRPTKCASLGECLVLR